MLAIVEKVVVNEAVALTKRRLDPTDKNKQHISAIVDSQYQGPEDAAKRKIVLDKLAALSTDKKIVINDKLFCDLWKLYHNYWGSTIINATKSVAGYGTCEATLVLIATVNSKTNPHEKAETILAYLAKEANWGRGFCKVLWDRHTFQHDLFTELEKKPEEVPELVEADDDETFCEDNEAIELNTLFIKDKESERRNLEPTALPVTQNQSSQKVSRKRYASDPDLFKPCKKQSVPLNEIAQSKSKNNQEDIEEDRFMPGLS